jgi:quercetin dioxygenase-like cupin family protein
MTEGATATLHSWDAIQLEAMSPAIDRQFLTGSQIMLARVLLKKGAHVPLHAHPNEQVAYILEGALRFALQGREVVVRAGEVLCIPPDVPHEAWALEDTVDLDVFTPPRQDWLSGQDSYLREGAAAASANAGPASADPE